MIQLKDVHVDSGASLHMMGISLLTPQDKKTIRRTKRLGITNCKCFVLSATEEKVHVKGLGTHNT